MSQEQNSTEKRKCQHLTLAERKTVERVLGEGANKAQVARALFRDKSVIKREIKRGSVTQRKRNPYEGKNAPEFVERKAYFADAGQRVYDEGRMRGGAKSKLARCAEMLAFVESKVLGAEKWSLDAAVGFAAANGIFEGARFTAKTFYNWADAGSAKAKNIGLLLKVRLKPKKARKERKKKLGRSIEERPAEAEGREEFGHWEGDGIVGANQQGFLISLAERKLGTGFLFNVGNRDSANIVKVLKELQARFGDKFAKIFKTPTFDNGSEFARSEEMEKIGGLQVFYAHPYSSFERGTNENWNGIVRRFLPKGSSFEGLTQDIALRIANYMNTLPRKRFGYKSPMDLWEAELDAILAS